MERILYLNGQYLLESQAKVSLFDRGFLFSEAIYEMIAVLDGVLIDNLGHLSRLRHSANELDMRLPISVKEIVRVQKELIRRNRLVEGSVYLQLTRGTESDRNFHYSEETKPTLASFTQSRPLLSPAICRTGIKVISCEDIRWRRRDIKTTSLIPACMAKNIARKRGADDVWFIEDGYVTEGGSSNAYIITQEDKLVTRPLSKSILHGITRAFLMQLSRKMGVDIEERTFTIEEAYAAKEAFISSATVFVLPVVEIDGRPIADGRPGPLSLNIREVYISAARALARDT